MHPGIEPIPTVLPVEHNPFGIVEHAHETTLRFGVDRVRVATGFRGRASSASSDDCYKVWVYTYNTPSTASDADG